VTPKHVDVIHFCVKYKFRCVLLTSTYLPSALIVVTFIMPGSSMLFGVLPLTNSRHIFARKPKIITYDAEVYLGLSEDGSPCSAQAVVHYFVPQGTTEPFDNSLYFVVGKLASVRGDTCVSEGHSTEDYDIEIDAMMMQEMPVDTPPMRPVITICGASGQKSSNHAFHIDVNQYVAGETRIASYICTFPQDNKRFQSLGIPKLGSNVVVTGFITSEAVSDGAVTCLPLEVKELAFLSSEVNTSPAKVLFIEGKTAKWKWGSKSQKQPGNEGSSPSKPDASVTSPSKCSCSDSDSDIEDEQRPTKRCAHTSKPDNVAPTQHKGKGKAPSSPSDDDEVVEVKQEFVEGSSISPLTDVGLLSDNILTQPMRPKRTTHRRN
ncbi:hypothetical protein M405DRAFT_891574, partial [Rhizopogon salebrosus TDB-379]